MCKTMSLLQAVRELFGQYNITPDEYVITASGHLGARRVREINDVDLVVGNAAGCRVRNDHEPVVEGGRLKIKVQNTDIEIFCAQSFVNDPPGMPSAEDQLHDGVMIEGLRYVSLETLLQMKRVLDRP